MIENTGVFKLPEHMATSKMILSSQSINENVFSHLAEK